jgi:hypothetical protein
VKSRRRRIPAALVLVSMATTLLAAAVAYAQASASSGASSPPPPWLARINMYRAMEELPPLASDPALTAGSQNHAVYLIKNFGKLVRNGGGLSSAIDTESSAKPFYTSAGRTAAPHCEVDFAFSEHQSQERAVDRWIEGPLHRLLLLNPALQRIGYGYYCEEGLCAQAVDVVDGIAQQPVDPEKQVALEFPPVNSTLSINDLPHETPNPLAACPGYRFPVGLPITFAIGSFVGAKLTAYSIVRKDDPGAPRIEACGYDAYSYRNEARSQMSQVVGRLKAFSSVVVIPRHPLAAGNYRVSVTVNGSEYSWSFAIAPDDSRSASR